MKLLLIFCAVISVGLTKSVTLLKPSELTIDLLNNPRYLVWETKEGLFEVEDLESPDDSNVTLFATEDDISFYVFTPQNPDKGVQIRERDLHNIVALTGFDINRPTLVVIHGWKNDYEAAVNDRIKTAALKTRNINVLVVDWSPIANRNYISAQRSVLAVGNYIGDILLRLDDELNHKIKHITVVGHSLGAHISGNVGARTKGLIETIIGLDPAGPLFTSRNTDNRLDPTDGKFVHVIHTNDGTLGFGINMGHADYYPNGGSSQPGCGIDLTGACSHSRAYEYFAESLKSNNFVTKKCDTYRNYDRNRCDNNVSSYMGGYPIKETEEGEYYLKTSNASPFARG
ncbi:pancreatic triacylglycerol lipase-like [Euwallacea similis]|uniref:pancreatic triacylglycerol lipase-like n=1 Tax=Euwallacea similis TaxID=1736056 RepID=UPI00344C692B